MKQPTNNMAAPSLYPPSITLTRHSIVSQASLSTAKFGDSVRCASVIDVQLNKTISILDVRHHSHVRTVRYNHRPGEKNHHLGDSNGRAGGGGG